MKFCAFVACFLLLLAAPLAQAGGRDYLAIQAEGSEIKAIGEVVAVRRVSNNSDGTFKQVTFRRIYALTPYIPKNFVGGCKTMEYAWQKRTEGMVYFKPRKGQRVYVTVSTNGGAITSYTPISPGLEAAIRTEPERLGYSHGRARVLPGD
jgi:hypothetical protein